MLNILIFSLSGKNVKMTKFMCKYPSALTLGCRTFLKLHYFSSFLIIAFLKIECKSEENVYIKPYACVGFKVKFR